MPFFLHHFLEDLVSNKTVCYLPSISMTYLEKSQNYKLIVILTIITNILIASVLHYCDTIFLFTTLHIRGLYKIAVWV